MLLSSARSEENELIREVVSSFNCLSSVEENKIEVAERAMCTIIGMMLSGNLFINDNILHVLISIILGDVIIERHAVCTAANLMEMPELHSRLLEERGIPPLVALCCNEDVNSKGEACRCVANLSVNPDMHQILIKEGVLAPMVSSLESHDLNCQRFSSLCLANLATTVAAQVKVIQAGK